MMKLYIFLLLLFNIIIATDYHQFIDNKIHITELNPNELTTSLFAYFIASNSPFIIRKYAQSREWTALNKWSNLSYIADKVNNNQLIRIEEATDRTFYFTDDKLKARNATIQEIVTCLKERPGTCYVAQVSLQAFHELIHDLTPPPNHTTHFTGIKFEDFLIWIGSGKQRTPLHFDEAENLLVVISGRKTIRLYDFTQSKYLYPQMRDDNNAITIASRPKECDPLTLFNKCEFTDEWLATYPLLSKANGITVTLDKGDLIYLPTQYWHEVLSEGKPHIAVNIWYNTNNILRLNQRVNEYLYHWERSYKKRVADTLYKNEIFVKDFFNTSKNMYQPKTKSIKPKKKQNVKKPRKVQYSDRSVEYTNYNVKYSNNDYEEEYVDDDDDAFHDDYVEYTYW